MEYIYIMLYFYLVEFVGVVIFTYIVLVTKNPLAIGATLAMLLLVCGKTCRGGFNPAVAIAQVVDGSMAPRELLPICASQILGALVAVELVKRYTL